MTNHTDDTTTERRPSDPRRAGNRQRPGETDRTMAGVSHTNPATGESFGDSQVFHRGKVAMVDGGEPGERRSETDDDGTDSNHEDEPMGDVDHTPREGAPSSNTVYTRGSRDPADDSEPEEADAEESEEAV